MTGTNEKYKQSFIPHFVPQVQDANVPKLVIGYAPAVPTIYVQLFLKMMRK